MRFRKIVLTLAVALLGSALVCNAAFAGGRGYGYGGGYHGYPRASVGVYVGPGWYGPRPYWGGAYWGGAYWGWPYAYGALAYPYYSPPYYYPPAVVAPSAPQVYIERDPQPSAPAQPQQQQSQWWYFCPGANGYYPYVKECPGGWQRVAPLPPS